MTAPAPKLSICLPAYNYAHFLPKAIESVLIQDFKDYELIILDDVSPDNTQEIAMEYAKKDPRIRYILNEKNLGAIENCNKGVAVARGEYVAFLSADDFYLPGWLQAGVDFLESNLDVDLVYCKTILVDSENHYCNTTTIPSFANFSHKGRDELREHIKTGGSFFHLAATIMRKRMMNELGFYKKWNMQQGFSAEDWEANLNFSLHKIEGYINRPYYAFRVHDSNFSSLNKVLENGALVRSHLYILDKFLTPETTYRIRGAQKEALRSLFGQVNMLSKQAPEIAEKVLPEIYPQLNDVKNRLVQLGQLPITPLSEQPLVTVVIPTVNMASCAGNTLFPSGRDIFFILNALESLQKQTYTKWQAIIVNDGGEDILPLLEDFKQQYQLTQNIQYLYFNINRGQAVARNIALDFIWQSELVAFLDDDDMYLPDHLENIVQKLKGTAIPCVYTNYVALIERCANGTRIVTEENVSHLPPAYSKTLLAVKNYIPMSTVVVRRECILDHNTRFNTELKILEDWEFLLKLSNWYEFTYFSEKTVEIREREGKDNVHQLYAQHYAESYEKICDIYKVQEKNIQQHRREFLTKINDGNTRLKEREIYQCWRNKKDQYTEQNLLTFVQKMQQDWRFLPQFLILITVDAQTVQHFQTTLDSLKEQYYTNYLIFVIKKGDCSLGEFEEDVIIQDIYKTDSDIEIEHVVRSLARNNKSDWIFTVPAGAMLKSQCLLAIVDTLNQDTQDMLHLLYFDEDKLYVRDGHFADVQFKTDFNLDLFRAYPTYIGTCLAVRSDTVKTYQLSVFTSGWNYALSLNIYAAFGHEAIGHIDDIFVHMLQDIEVPALESEVYQCILSQHLARYGISVPVVKNALSHRPKQFFFDVQYQSTHNPHVTILCTTIDDVKMWMQNVVQLLTQTHYEAYDFAVMTAAFSQHHKEILSFYVALQKQDSRCRLIQSITEIASPYVFYFSEQTFIPTEQENWLNRLVGCIERKDISIDMVKPAFVDTETDLSVDLFASAKQPTVALLERQQLPQHFVHIDSLEGILIKAKLLRDPHFDLAHSQYTVSYLPTVRLVCTKRPIKQTNHLCWMHDPISYNKNLSLKDLFQVETEFLVNWRHDKQPSAIKKVLQLSSQSIGFFNTLATQGMIQYTVLETEKRTPLLDELLRFKPDIIVLTLQDYDKALHQYMPILKEKLADLRIILVIDNFSSEMQASNIIAYYSFRIYLHAFDYVSKILLVEAEHCARFQPYLDVFSCASLLISEEIATHPEKYLDILF